MTASISPLLDYNCNSDADCHGLTGFTIAECLHFLKIICCDGITTKFDNDNLKSVIEKIKGKVVRVNNKQRKVLTYPDIVFMAMVKLWTNSSH